MRRDFYSGSLLMQARVSKLAFGVSCRIVLRMQSHASFAFGVVVMLC